ncbi:MAG TPA: hypothetical protein VJ725_34685 [Thermoanaerobaculia bacterium]|nr:hypothetical protein [Thermoanaerobaculia bacterium]
MATYTNKIHYDGSWYRVYGDHLCWKEATSRTYANGDIILGPHLALGTVIADALVTHDELDTNAAPTATGVLELFKTGETPIPIVSVSAATLGIADGATRLNNRAAHGHVVASTGWYIRFRFTAAFATAGSGKINFGINLSGHVPSGGGDPTNPTG